MKYTPEYYAALEQKIPRGKLRSRFAPSPTGYMHVGNLRTALYAYLLAKKAGGDFLLRIEDTDQERSSQEAAELIYRTLREANLLWDEGPDTGGPVAPYIQSERREIYAAYAELLISRGAAYRCFCDKGTLEHSRSIYKASGIAYRYDGRCAALNDKEITAKLAAGVPYVVRQRIPAAGVTAFDDLVYGRIEVNNAELDDPVLLKSDEMPTYNFSNVVDDHLMGITHVIRGSEYLSSTPKYNLLYESFGWKIPAYIHCPPVMKDAVQKFSKRNGDASYGDLIQRGYLKDAVLNYIALLGWAPGDEQEKFTLAELIEAFGVEGISRSPAIFDYKKLNWLNGAYLRAMSDEQFHAAALPFIKAGVKRGVDTAYLASVLKERCETLSEIPGLLDFIDVLPEYSPELYRSKKMGTDPENSKEALEKMLPALEALGEWRQETIHAALFRLIEDLNVKNGRVLWPLRVALSGKAFTPGGGVELATLLGKSETLARVRAACAKIVNCNTQITHADGECPAGDGLLSASQPSLSVGVDLQIDPQNTSVDLLEPKRRNSEKFAGLIKLDFGEEAAAFDAYLNSVTAMTDKLVKTEFSISECPLDTAFAQPLRPDTVGRSVPRAGILARAPAVEAGCISVPKIMAREE